MGKHLGTTQPILMERFLLFFSLDSIPRDRWGSLTIGAQSGFWNGDDLPEFSLSLSQRFCG